MSLPHSHARRPSQGDVTTTTPGRLATGAPTSVSRLSTSHSSSRPFSTASKSLSISSKNSSLPEKQLLSRYRHVYAGKGGWYQGRASYTPQANYSAGQNGRHLDVYRKELILRLSKDIFENSKAKLASADRVVSNKVAGDNTHDVIGDVAQPAVTTRLDKDTTMDMTSLDDDHPLPSKSARVHRDDIIPHVTSRSEKYRPTKSMYNGLNTTRHYRDPSASLANPLALNLRSGSQRVALETDKSTQQRLQMSRSVAAGGRLNAAGVVVVHDHAVATSSIDKTSPNCQKADEKTQHVHGELSGGSTLANNQQRCDFSEKHEHNQHDQTEELLTHYQTLNGSDSIHLESGLESRNIASSHNRINVAVQIDYANDSKRLIINERNGIRQNGIHKDKSAIEGQRESKCLNNEEPEEGTTLRAEKNPTCTEGQIQSTTEETDQNNNTQAPAQTSAKKTHKVRSLKPSETDKSSANLKSKSKAHPEEDQLLDNILGEIQFNVLRQRSFIRVPKKVAKVASVLETARRTSDVAASGGDDSHRLLSRMSFSQEARNALLETRKEMHLEDDVDMDKFDIRKLNQRNNKRPSTPKPETPPSARETASSSDSNASLVESHVMSPRTSPRKTPAKKHIPMHSSDARTPRRTLTARSGNNDVPILLLEDSREKLEHQAESLTQTRQTGSRSSTVATPVIDLVAAVPRDQQENYMRYSTNMSRDTARANQRVAALKTRATMPGSLLTPRAHLNNEKPNGFQPKKNKMSYAIPLKAGLDYKPGDNLRNNQTNNATGSPTKNESDSIKSDWESQYRAMSKYGLITEKSFQITPPGWDERYKDLALKNNKLVKQEKDVDVTLAEVKKEAIEKCSDWLQRCN